MALMEDYLGFLDTETGGLVPGKFPVIEVACIITDMKLKEVARFEKKIRLRKGDVVGPKAAAMNGYTPEVWAKEAVPMQTFMDFLSYRIPRGHVAVPIGHNIQFDIDMLREGYFSPIHQFFPFSFRKVDTIAIAMAMKVSGMIDVPNVKLTTVSEALGIEHSKAHTAMADVEVCKEMFQRTVSVFSRVKVK